MEYFYCRGRYLLHLTETPSSAGDANLEPLLYHTTHALLTAQVASPTSFSSMNAISQWKSEDRLGVMKQYGARGGGYSGNHRLYTPSFGSRAPRVDTLPNILWKVSGVTTRPASGLRLTVKNVNVPHAGLQEMRVIPEDSRSTLSQRTSARFSRPDPTNHPLRATAQSHLGRSTGLGLPSRQQQSTPTAPKATRTMLPPITTSPTSPLTDEPLQTSEHSSTSNQGVSSSLEESDSEDEVEKQFNENLHFLIHLELCSCCVCYRSTQMMKKKMKFTILRADLGLSQKQREVPKYLKYHLFLSPTPQPPSLPPYSRITCNLTWKSLPRPYSPQD